MHRRSFVAGMLGTGMGGALRLRAQDSGESGLSPGLQLFTIRGLMQDDVPAALALVAEIGYRHVEFAGYFGYPARDLRLMLDDTGLVAPATHVSQAGMTENPERRSSKLATASSGRQSRSASGAHVRRPGPVYSAPGRMSLLSARCSNTCADQPVMREHTKIGVNRYVGMPMKR